MSGGVLKILMVDDSEFILQRLQSLLVELRQVREVRSAISAEDGMQVLKDAYQPDLVILDINLPGKNGLQMLKDIRQLKGIDPVVIILTNNTLSGYKAECLQYGADYFLDKSRDFQIIPSIIEKTSQKLYPQHVF